LKNDQHILQELWVSDVNGSRMHLVGALTMLLPPGSGLDGITYPNGISELKWLPGGQRLSFESNNVLYTVPAD
ncbi:MAG TPA: hypothetical protein VKU00_14710, partial [Chthonomonadaceae bacterium]|nr:hypothetical protein [Chthonomonadaceae bacterium]